MPTLHRNHSIASTISDHPSPAQYESFEAPYRPAPVNVRSSGYDRRVSFRRSQSFSQFLNFPNSDWDALPSPSPSLGVLCSSPPPDSPASTMSRRGSTQNGSASAFVYSNSSASIMSGSTMSRRGSTLSNTSTSSSDDLYYTRLVCEALLEAFPDGIPELHNGPPEVPEEVLRFAEEFVSVMWGCRLCYLPHPFRGSAPPGPNAQAYNPGVIRNETIDYGDGMIVDFAVTRDHSGRERLRPMVQPRFCPCGKVT